MQDNRSSVLLSPGPEYPPDTYTQVPEAFTLCEPGPVSPVHCPASTWQNRPLTLDLHRPLTVYGQHPKFQGFGVHLRRNAREKHSVHIIHPRHPIILHQPLEFQKYVNFPFYP